MFPAEKWPFSRASLEGAPDDAGVFVLWDADQPLYIGRVREGSLKAELIAHWEGLRGECTMHATHCSWEVTVWAAARETELLNEFHKRYGKGPRCQARITSQA